MKASNTHALPILLLSAMGIPSVASAMLVPQLGGQVVYDTDLNITWLADANLAASFRISGLLNWNGAQDMVAAMNP